MSRKTDATEATIEASDEIELPPMGALSRERQRAAVAAMNTSEIEPAGDLAGLQDKAAMLAFMVEELDVMILDSADPNPEPYVFLSVNGRGPMPGPAEMSVWCPRNTPIKMQRMYVEVLACAKPINFRTQESRDNEGYKTTILKSASALRYPFQVLNDPNPRGPRWLAEMLRRR